MRAMLEQPASATRNPPRSRPERLPYPALRARTRRSSRWPSRPPGAQTHRGPEHGHPRRARHLASTYKAAGRLPEAIALDTSARRRPVGPEHADTLSRSTTSPGHTGTPAGSPRRSPYTSASATPRRQARPRPSQHPAHALNLAEAYQAAGRFPEATALLERVRDALIAKLGPDHPDTPITLNNLALAYLAVGKLPEAIALLERVRDAEIARLGPDHPDTLNTLSNLATAYLRGQARRGDRPARTRPRRQDRQARPRPPRHPVHAQ